MASSLGFALYLMAAGRLADGAEAAVPKRPRGDALVWLHAPAGGATLSALVSLAWRLRAERGGLALALTHPRGALPATLPLPAGAMALPAFPDDPELMRRVFAAWAPAAVVIGDGPLPPALIHAADEADRHAVLVDAGPPRLDPRWASLPGLQRALLRRLRRILARDAAAARALRRAGARPWRIEEVGRMAETAGPLPCNAAEREAVARRLGGRPVWLAVAVPEVEEIAVLAAHRAAQRAVHRLLLLIVPADPARGAALVEAAAGLGLRAARRAAEQEPEDDVQVYIADTEGELGLWYRLAPVCLMGGTLSDRGRPGRDPMEAAALGTAILHGPATAGHAASYARLAAAGATLRVSGLEAPRPPAAAAGPGSLRPTRPGSGAAAPCAPAAAGRSAPAPVGAAPALRAPASPASGFWQGLRFWLRGVAAPPTSAAAVGADALAEAVVALLAPDRVALMAGAGWSVATEGADVTERVAALVLGMVDEVAAP